MIKPADIKENTVDRIIKYFSPVRAQERFKARAMLAMSGSYIGASTSRRALSEWYASTKNADSDILPDLPTLRERSRDLDRNSPIATGAVNTVVTNVVGTGLKLYSRIDRDVLNMTDDQADEWEATAEREWRLWADTTECDVTRTMNFSAIQELCMSQVLLNGDVFVPLPRISRKNSPYSLKLQVIEADRVCNIDDRPNDNEVAGGIKKNEYGAPVEYYVLKQHPGNSYSLGKREWQTIPAYGKNSGLRNILHLLKVQRPGQSRGVPFLAPVIETIKQMTKYTEAEIMAAVISGMFTVFIKTESENSFFAPMEPTTETGGSKSDKDYRLAPGAILGLAQNEDVVTTNPGRPNTAFDPFMMAILRQIGAALGIPFEFLIKHFTASFSASQAAIMEAWKVFSARRKWLVDTLCVPVYEIWMCEAVAKGRLSAPGFFNDPVIRAAYLGSEWVGPARGVIKETEAVKAALERIEGNISTHQYETAQLLGQDWEKNNRQLLKERKRIGAQNEVNGPRDKGVGDPSGNPQRDDQAVPGVPEGA